MSDDPMKDDPIRKRKGFFLLFVSSFIFSSFITLPAHALSLIRDAEVEYTLHKMADPIFRAADLNPSAIHLFIVQDPAINAFVAGGQNMFIHTGLLLAMDTPGMLIGVMAHESGHIAGGHLARGSEKLRNAQLGTILSFVLGAAATAAGGSDVGAAVLSGSQNVLQRNLLAYTRSNEQAADEAALRYLDQLKISASGLVSTFQLLRRHEMRQFGTPDPYTRTHPLSQDRIEVVRNHAEHSSIPEGQYPKDLDLWHQRMRAKLFAFLELPPKTFARYPEPDKSIPARMARAVAWYKIPELNKALAEVEALQKELPHDPFIYDLKGQILFENGRVKDALTAYDKAVSLMPDSPLLLVSLAEVQITVGDQPNLRKAVQHLEHANTLDNSNSRGWRLLATAYGKLGDLGQSHLALAEEALLQTNPEAALEQTKQAVATLPPNSPARLRAQDIEQQATRMKEELKDSDE